MSKQQSPRQQREVQQSFLPSQSGAQNAAHQGLKYPGGIFVKAATLPQPPHQSHNISALEKSPQSQKQLSAYDTNANMGAQRLTQQQQSRFLPLLTEQFGNQAPNHGGLSKWSHGNQSANQLQQPSQPANAGALKDLAPNANPEYNNMPHDQANYSNPKTIFFHLLFKGLAILIYVFGGWVTSSFVLLFVAIVMLAAVDFWVVKNVSGRLLVGLRYWNESDEAGNSIWRFESLDQRILDQLNAKDTTIFWTTLYAIPAIWVLLGVIALIKFNFDYLMIVIIALIMGVSNIVGFTRCHKDAKKKAQGFAERAMGGFMRDAVSRSIINGLSKSFSIF